MKGFKITMADGYELVEVGQTQQYWESVYPKSVVTVINVTPLGGHFVW